MTTPNPERDVSVQPVPVADADFIHVTDLVAAYDDKIVIEGLSFSVCQGEQMSLLGPSGCGKSTALRCIAGLEKPLAGEIVIGGDVVFSSQRRINLPPEKRNLSMVFQSYAIWPHMSVFENVVYGLRSRGKRGSILRERAEQALAVVSMVELIDRPATALSGGEQQRVALARAYATVPKAMLLDEPLSNLDARLRVQMRDELKEIQRGTRLTTLYVTHDQEEAMAMSDRIIVMRNGAIEQVGQPLDIYNRPRSRFVADFVGSANILVGAVEHDSSTGILVARIGAAQVECAPSPLLSKPQSDGKRLIAVRTVYPELSVGPPRVRKNQWSATISRRALLGDTVHYGVVWPGGELRVHGLPGAIFEEGQIVQLHIPPEHVVMVDAD